VRTIAGASAAVGRLGDLILAEVDGLTPGLNDAALEGVARVNQILTAALNSLLDEINEAVTE